MLKASLYNKMIPI